MTTQDEKHRINYEKALQGMYKDPKRRKESLSIWEGYTIYTMGIEHGRNEPNQQEGEQAQ